MWIQMDMHFAVVHAKKTSKRKRVETTVMNRLLSRLRFRLGCYKVCLWAFVSQNKTYGWELFYA